MKAHTYPEKYGWRVNEWAAAVGSSRSRVCEWIADGTVKSVRMGGSRVILTHPRDFLEALAQNAG